MGSMILSTFMMFTPAAANYLFLIIMGVIFLAVVDPYQWKKKWTKKKLERTKQHDRPEAIPHTKDLEKLKAWRDAGLISPQEYREKNTRQKNGHRKMPVFFMRWMEVVVSTDETWYSQRT